MISIAEPVALLLDALICHDKLNIFSISALM